MTEMKQPLEVSELELKVAALRLIEVKEAINS